MPQNDTTEPQIIEQAISTGMPPPWGVSCYICGRRLNGVRWTDQHGNCTHLVRPEKEASVYDE